MSDERLPFPVHGTRRGEGAPSGAEHEALRLLYTVNLIAQAAKVPVFSMHRPVDGGVVYASVNGPLTFKRIEGAPPKKEDPPDEGDDTRLVWVPEGFVITPRTADAPDGFGMPPTVEGAGTVLNPLRPGKGTPGGPLTQVIINRYKDNQYPDALYRAQGRAEDFRLTCAPLFFMDWERDKRPASITSTPPEKLDVLGIGMDLRRGDEWEWQQQFDPNAQSRWAQNFKEAAGDKWVCHRPADAIGYLGAAGAAILKDTNLLRESASMTDLAPPLRGTEGILSASVLYQMDYAGQIEHDHPDYREGYRTFDARYKRREGASGSAGENLFASTNTDQGGDLGHEAVEWWRTSPGHYANIIDSWEDDFWAAVHGLSPQEHKLHATLDPAIRGGARLPSLSTGGVSTASQIFHSREAWVYPAIPTRSGAAVNAGGHRDKGPCNKYFGWTRSFFERDIDIGEPGADKRVSTDKHVFIHGRAMEFRSAADNLMLPLAVTVAKIEQAAQSARQVIRICVLEALTDEGPEGVGEDRAVVIYEGDAADFLATRTEVGRFVMDAGQPDMSTPRFSASGDRLVFSYAELVVPDTSSANLEGMWPSLDLNELRVVRPPFDTPAQDLAAYMWGDELHFVEWVYGRETGFLEVATDSLTAQVSFTPAAYAKDDGPVDSWSISGSIEAYQSTVDGECRLLADYDGEEIVYLRIKVKCTHQYGTATGEARGDTFIGYDVKQKGTLIFPDGTELVYQDRHVRPYDGPRTADTVVTGFFVHLCHLDILRPDLTVYLRHEMGFESRTNPGSPWLHEARWTSVDSLWLGKKKLRDMGEVLQQPFLQAPNYDSQGSWSAVHKGAVFPYQLYREQWFHEGGAGPYRAHDSVGFVQDGRSSYEYGHHLVPVAPFKVSVVSPTIFHCNRADFEAGGMYSFAERSFGESYVISDDFLFVGPLFLSGITGFFGRARNQRTEVVTYGGEYLVAGCIQRPFPITESTDPPTPRYFWDSSLDLKAVTGLDLDDNILPIGVL